MKLINKNKLPEAIEKLNNLYSKVPATEGCMENLPTCKGKCCLSQNPSLSHVEFRNYWNNTLKLELNQICKIISDAIWNYLIDSSNKSCINFDKNERTCTIHEIRPLACRVYSQEPEEQFNKRLIRLKVLNPQNYFMEQCGLTKTVGNKPTVEDTKNWSSELDSIEESVGIKDVNENYLSFHDHIIQNLISSEDLKIFNDAKISKDIRLQGAVLGSFMARFTKKMEAVEKSVIDNLKAKEIEAEKITPVINEMDLMIEKLKSKKELTGEIKPVRLNSKNLNRQKFEVKESKPKKNRTGW